MTKKKMIIFLPIFLAGPMRPIHPVWGMLTRHDTKSLRHGTTRNNVAWRVMVLARHGMAREAMTSRWIAANISDVLFDRLVHIWLFHKFWEVGIDLKIILRHMAVSCLDIDHFEQYGSVCPNLHSKVIPWNLSPSWFWKARCSELATLTKAS